jgi:hypothetical protein
MLRLMTFLLVQQLGKYQPLSGKPYMKKMHSSADNDDNLKCCP